MTAREVCLFIIVALLVSSCGRDEQPRLPIIGRAFVGTKTLKVRKDLAFHSPVLVELRFGDKLDVLQRRRFNLQVRTPDNQTGWIDGRAVIGQREVDALRRMAVEHKQTTRVAVARASDTLRIHTVPNRESPGFDVVGEADRMDVLGQRLSLRVPYVPPALPEPPGRKKKKKEKTDSGDWSLPPAPAPPKPPENWQGAAASPESESTAGPKKRSGTRNVKNALLLKAEESARQKKGPTYEDWSLVRLANGNVGWALTSALVMDIPEELQNQIGRNRVTSLLPVGSVTDPEAGPKQHWFFTTISKRAQVHQFDAMGLAFFSTKSHRYVRIFQQTGVTGYFPVEVTNDAARPVVAVILENPDGTCSRRRFVLEGNRLKLLDQVDVPRPRMPQSLEDLPATAIPEPAEDEGKTWWGQLMTRLFGK